MRIVHALSVQLRQVCSWKLLSCMLIFAVVQGIAISGLMYATPDPSALYYYVLSTTSGTTYLTFYVLPTIPFSMSLAQEWDAHATPYWIIRSGGGVYTFSKLAGGAAAGFLTVGGGSLLFLISAGIIAGNFGPSEGIDTIYQSLMEQGQVMWALFLFILHNALSGATIGMLGTFFTILFHNQFVGVAAPLSFYLLLTRLLTGFPIAENSVYWPSSWFSAIHVGDSAYQVFGEKVLITVILCGVMCLVGILVMKRRLRHA
ncbi:putative uncharacterized protein [Clostridium sp. CAG:1013]|nr:putative uncharacterized protein [Clostridium sp. CAG:1013]